jgi:transcriptional regulator with XRE-family HTH domain
MVEHKQIELKIREIREKKGISQSQLAELTGLKQQSIARIESGKYSTGSRILENIADSLGVSVELIEK